MSLQAMRAVLDAQIPDINSTRRLVLLELANYASPRGLGIRPSLATIGERAVMSRTTVRACLTWAEAANIIKCTKPGRGRGHVNVWAMNLELLDLWKAAPKSDDNEDAPDFGPLPNDIKRVSERPFYETQKGQLASIKGQLASIKGQPLTPILLEPIKNLSARGASARPEGRSPRCGEQRPAAARGASERSGNGARGSAPPAITSKALVKELDVVVDPVALNLWGGLVCAIVARRQIEAARAWLCRRNVVQVNDQCEIIAANRLAFDRINQTFGALLAEQGWRVAMSGAGG